MDPWLLFAYKHTAIAAVICFVPISTALFCAAFYVGCGALFGVNPFDDLSKTRRK